MSRPLIIQSILDTDLYKLTQQQAVLHGSGMGISYEEVNAGYEFINRANTPFPDGFADKVNEQVELMAGLALTDSEYWWMRRTLPFLNRSYLDYLHGYRFDPDEVHVSQIGSELKITIKGPWYRTILWEVPLMAIVSELYSEETGTVDSEWEDRIHAKANYFDFHRLSFAEFGTRRRRSFFVQDSVVRIMSDECKYFIGTSNVFLAMKYGVKAIGTHAHEWFSAHAALFGYRLANFHALQAWVDEFQGDLGIALTDTFTTNVFFDAFGTKFAKLFDGVRHDSGCPLAFADKVVAHYRSLNIDPKMKTIIFSDGLNPEECKRIRDHVGDRIKCAFGIGTNLTNDCGHKALNMVIKLVEVKFRNHRINTVKLSDVPGKNTGDPNEIALCKSIYGLEA